MWRQVDVTLATMLLLSAARPGTAMRQGGGMGGPPAMGGMAREQPVAPKLPGVELEGPPDLATARALLELNDEQATRYAQAYDSFMVATRPQRDSATAATEKMNARLDGGDIAAALFYAERLRELGKPLDEQLSRFEDRLRRVLTGDQVKAFHRWREQRDREIEARQREDALRWRVTPAFGIRLPTEQKSFIDVPSVPRPEAGAQAVRIGRTVFTAAQVALDSAGAIVGGGDLRAQAERAFANLTTVLQAARAAPRDVVQLTIYVVDYRPEELATIREAGVAYFPSRNAPITTVLGVQSLSRPGLRIAVQASAVTAAPGPEGERTREAPPRQ